MSTSEIECDFCVHMFVCGLGSIIQLCEFSSNMMANDHSSGYINSQLKTSTENNESSSCALSTCSWLQHLMGLSAVLQNEPLQGQNKGLLSYFKSKLYFVPLVFSFSCTGRQVSSVAALLDFRSFLCTIVHAACLSPSLWSK